MPAADLAPAQAPPPHATADSDKWEQDARAPTGDTCTGICCFGKGQLPSKYEGELGTHWLDPANAALTIQQAEALGTAGEALKALKESLKVRETDDKLFEWQRDEVHKKCQETMQWTGHMRSSKGLKAKTIRSSANQNVVHAAITVTKAFITMVSHGGYRGLNQQQLIALRDTTHPGALPLEVNEMPMLVDYNWYHVLPHGRHREVMLLVVFARGGEIAAEIEATGAGADTFRAVAAKTSCLTSTVIARSSSGSGAHVDPS